MNTKHNEECCTKCKREKDSDYWIDKNTPIYDCINEECTCHSATDVSWETEFDENIIQWLNDNAPLTDLKEFIRKQIDLAYDAGGKTVGGTGRVMYEKGYEEGLEEGKRWHKTYAEGRADGQYEGRKEVIAEIKPIVFSWIDKLCDEITATRLKRNIVSALEALSNK